MSHVALWEGHPHPHLQTKLATTKSKLTWWKKLCTLLRAGSSLPSILLPLAYSCLSNNGSSFRCAPRVSCFYTHHSESEQPCRKWMSGQAKPAIEENAPSNTATPFSLSSRWEDHHTYRHSLQKSGKGSEGIKAPRKMNGSSLVGKVGWCSSPFLLSIILHVCITHNSWC